MSKYYKIAKLLKKAKDPIYNDYLNIIEKDYFSSDDIWKLILKYDGYIPNRLVKQFPDLVWSAANSIYSRRNGTLEKLVALKNVKKSDELLKLIAAKAEWADIRWVKPLILTAPSDIRILMIKIIKKTNSGADFNGWKETNNIVKTKDPKLVKEFIEYRLLSPYSAKDIIKKMDIKSLTKWFVNEYPEVAYSDKDEFFKELTPKKQIYNTLIKKIDNKEDLLSIAKQVLLVKNKNDSSSLWYNLINKGSQNSKLILFILKKSGDNNIKGNISDGIIENKIIQSKEIIDYIINDPKIRSYNFSRKKIIINNLDKSRLKNILKDTENKYFIEAPGFIEAIFKNKLQNDYFNSISNRNLKEIIRTLGDKDSYKSDFDKGVNYKKLKDQIVDWVKKNNKSELAKEVLKPREYLRYFSKK